QRTYKPAYVLGRLGFGTIELARFAYYECAYCLAGHIRFDIRQHIFGMHRLQRRGNKLQRVGYRDADPFSTVIKSHNTHPAKVRYLTFTSTLILPTSLLLYSCRALPITWPTFTLLASAFMATPRCEEVTNKSPRLMAPPSKHTFVGITPTTPIGTLSEMSVSIVSSVSNTPGLVAYTPTTSVE